MVNRIRKSKAAVAFEEDSDNQESPTQPEETQAGTVFAQAEEMFDKDNKRRDSQRKAVLKEHEERVKTTKVKVNTLYNDRKTRVTKSQRVLWERLNNLNKRRQDLESQILQSMKRIEQQTANAARQIDAVLDGRIKDIEESATAE